MLVHIWACEIGDECDMMRCGLIIYFAPDSSILGPDDFVLEEGDGATCGDCVRASNTGRDRCSRSGRGRNRLMPKADFANAVVDLLATHVSTLGRVRCGKALVGIGVGLFFTSGLSEAEVRDKLLELIPQAKRLHDQAVAEQGTD